MLFSNMFNVSTYSGNMFNLGTFCRARFVLMSLNIVKTILYAKCKYKTLEIYNEKWNMINRDQKRNS